MANEKKRYRVQLFARVESVDGDQAAIIEVEVRAESAQHAAAEVQVALRCLLEQYRSPG